MPPKKRWIAWVAGAAVLVAVVLVLANRDQAPEVQIAEVKHETLSAFITSNGKVEPVQPFVAVAQYLTRVDRIEATAGQTVRRGQVILVLDSFAPQQQLDKARADLLSAEELLRNARAGGPPGQVAQTDGDLKKAKIDLANLEKNQEALKKLVAEKAATQEEFEQNQVKIAEAQSTVQTLEQQKAALATQAQANVQSAELAEQQARAQIATFGNQVVTATVKSPVNGTLYSLPVHLGEYVQVGQPVAAAADLHNVRVRAFIDEPDLGMLAPNQPVQVTWDGLPGRVWSGRTETIPKQVTTQGVRSVGEVLCSVQNSNLELIPGLSVDVRIETSRRQNALVVPRGAVQSDGSQHFVFVLNDDTLRRRAVQLGIADPTVFEVASGLNEGDRVALSGEITLRDGMTVHPVEANQ
ncbi:MAG: efflux RND transporter periplasmic adaptor subunit [Candidatus Acidiferrales bacterium]